MCFSSYRDIYIYLSRRPCCGKAVCLKCSERLPDAAGCPFCRAPYAFTDEAKLAQTQTQKRGVSSLGSSRGLPKRDFVDTRLLKIARFAHTSAFKHIGWPPTLFSTPLSKTDARFSTGAHSAGTLGRSSISAATTTTASTACAKTNARLSNGEFFAFCSCWGLDS